MAQEFELVLPQVSTEFDAKATSERLRILREFVKSELKEGIDNDYAVVPGTPKKSLLKPGAQKLRLLFGLGVRVSLSNRTIDHAANFYMVSYKAEIYHLASGKTIAECEGSANNFEKKYKTRKVWKKLPGGAKEQVEEETPIGDIINTLDKMSQKRAVVGGSIEATGSGDFFTQDLDDESDLEANGLKANKDQVKRNADEDGTINVPNCDTDKCESKGKPMFISKFVNNQTGKYDFYCGKCKCKKAAE